jgi:hypothetical protein
MPWNDAERFYMVCDTRRNGCFEFLKALEYVHYPPPNNAFDCLMTMWQRSPYAIASVPLVDCELAKSVALDEEVGMRLADGVPTLFADGARHDFPLTGDNVWTLENGTRPAQTASQLAEMLGAQKINTSV